MVPKTVSGQCSRVSSSRECTAATLSCARDKSRCDDREASVLSPRSPPRWPTCALPLCHCPVSVCVYVHALHCLCQCFGVCQDHPESAEQECTYTRASVHWHHHLIPSSFTQQDLDHVKGLWHDPLKSPILHHWPHHIHSTEPPLTYRRPILSATRCKTEHLPSIAFRLGNLIWSPALLEHCPSIRIVATMV